MHSEIFSRSRARARPVAFLAVKVTVAAVWMALLPTGDAQASVVRVPVGVPADCSRDVTADLNVFFDRVPDGSTVAFPTAGCYLTVGTVVVSGKTDVVIEGNGSRLVRTALSPQHLRYPRRNGYFRLLDATRTTVRGLHVEGTNNSSDYGRRLLDARGTERTVDCLSYLPEWGCWTVAFAFEHAFEVLGSVDSTIEDVSARDIWGDGVYVVGYDQFTAQRGHGVTVRNVRVDRNGRQGIAVARISDVTIDGFNLSRGRRSGVDLEPDSSGEVIESIEIRNSTIQTNLLAFASFGKGEVSDIYIHHNTITRTGVPWVFVRAHDGTRRHNWRVHNNDVTWLLASPHPGLLFDNVEGADVRGNVNRYKSGYPTDAVGLYNASTARVECNWFKDARAVVVDRDGSGSTGSAAHNSMSDTPPSGCSAATVPESLVTITQPADGSTVVQGNAIDLAAKATDREGADVTPGITWTSSIDGLLGTGGKLSAHLSPGTHTLTASIPDAAGEAVAATVNVVVERSALAPNQPSSNQPAHGPRMRMPAGRWREAPHGPCPWQKCAWQPWVTRTAPRI